MLVFKRMFYTPQMVNCVDKGKLWPAIAHYQKPYSIGKTDQQQRWKDAVSCGSKLWRSRTLLH